ncbi:MAG: hypothetical protein WAV78_30705, partial [Xanthobacteraceae bacterium]
MMKKLLLFCLLSPVFRDDVAPGWYLAAEKSGALACVGLKSLKFFWGAVSINFEKRCNHYRLILACMLSGVSRDRPV